MLDIIKSYFNKEEYYIIVTNNNLYIKNYQKVIDITDKEILIDINNRIIKITGQNLTLIKIISHDLSIKGIIESVKYL